MEVMELSASEGTLLIVDDNVVSRLILKKIFMDLGVQERDIVLLESGEGAVQEVRSRGGNVSIVVMDVCLKGELDGFQATKEILACKSAIPVVLISGATASDWSMQARSVGAVAIFQKPVSASDIMACLKPQRNRRCSDPCTPCVKTNDVPSSPLRAAVCSLDFAEVSILLKRGGVDAANECHAETGNTLLHTAARMGNSKMLKLLIDFGANVNAVSKKGYTPLHVAAWSGHVECVEVLLACGCNPGIASTRGFRAVDIAAPEVQDRQDVLAQLSDNKVGNVSPTIRPRLPRRRSLSGQNLPILMHK